MTSPSFVRMVAGEHGWSEWVNPAPGYLMKCCDCGLVHELEVAIMREIEPGGSGKVEAEIVHDPALMVAFRARRHEP